MPLYLIIAVVIVGAVAAAAISLWAVVIVIPVALLLVGYMLVKGNDATIERTRKEPSGTVHQARPGAGTANERVGQG